MLLEMQELTRRLEACADAGACCAEIHSALRDAAGSDEHDAALRACAAFLGASGGVTRQLLAALASLPDDERTRLLPLLDVALSDAVSGLQRDSERVSAAADAPRGPESPQEPPEAAQPLACARPELLAAFVDVATRELAALGHCAAPESRRWLRWSEQVLDALFASQRKDQQSAEPAEPLEPRDAPEQPESGQRTAWVVATAACLLRLHHALVATASALGQRPDLQLMTLAWKNLTKLATAFGGTLASSSHSAAPSEHHEDEEDTTAAKGTLRPGGAFSVEALLDAAVASLEDNAGHVLLLATAWSDATASATPTRPLTLTLALDATAVKLLRLSWRAFQGQLLAFAHVPSCALEDAVLALANVAATLLFVLGPQPCEAADKAALELRRLLDMALSLAEQLADAQQHHVATRRHVRSLLWHPAADVLRAVRQRQPVGVNCDDVESAIRWAHLLLLAAFSAADAPDVAALAVEVDALGLPSDARAVEEDAGGPDEARGRVAAALLTRFRECARWASLSRWAEAERLLAELLLGLLSRFARLSALQLVLLQQTLHPSGTQRGLCWELWRELLCHCWGHAPASRALELLLALALGPDDHEDDEEDRDEEDRDRDRDARVLAGDVAEDVCELLAAVYAHLPARLQRLCLAPVTRVVRVLCRAGPAHAWTPRVAAQFLLLDKLAACGLLERFRGDDKEAWVATYLPLSFECCGTALELLAGDATASHDDQQGVTRVLELCMLVLSAVLDDNRGRDADVAELSRILLPLACEALKQLARRPRGASRASSGVLRLDRSVSRATETTLALLGKLGPLLKRNEANRCAETLQYVLLAAEDAGGRPQRRDADADADGVLVAAACFLRSTLFDVQVAAADGPVVWRLLLALFRRLGVGCERATRPSLLRSVALDALYRLLAHSNVVEVAGAPVRSLLAAEARRALVDSVACRRMERVQVVEAVEAARAAVGRSLRRQDAAQRRAFRRRFPAALDDADEHGNEPERGEWEPPQHAETRRKRPAERSTAPHGKQRKRDHVVALCRELQASFSRLDGQSVAGAQLLDSPELERATAALHALLARTAAL